MFKILYDNLLPNFMKAKFNWMTILQMQKEEKEFNTRVPFVQLSNEHLKNCRVVANRESLLNLLPKEAIVAEIGVDEGVFSKQIMEICTPSKLHLIDAWDSEKYGEPKLNLIKKELNTLINNNSVIIHKGYSYSELEKFEDAYFDWIYIDTDHTYNTTCKELEVCSRKIKQNGLILGHDYVTRCYSNFTRYGVIEAVNEFCVKNNWELLFLTNETDRHLSYALRKI